MWWLIKRLQKVVSLEKTKKQASTVFQLVISNS